MNPGIFYIYEYNNRQKLRNVGFLKLIRNYHSCTLQLNARGIPVTYADTLKLCAFYLENDTVGATVLAEVPCTNRMVSARLNFAECQFPDGHTLNTMDGFFLPLSNGRILAAAVPGILVDTQKLLSVFETPPDEAPPENAKDTPEAEETEPNDSGAVSENPVMESGQEKDEPEVPDAEPVSEESAVSEMPDDRAEREEHAAPEAPDDRSEREEPAVPEIPDARPEREEPTVPEMPDVKSKREEPVVPEMPDSRPEHAASAAPEREKQSLQMQNVFQECEEPAPQEQDIIPNCDKPVPQEQNIIPNCEEPAPQVQEPCPENCRPKSASDTPQQTARKIQRSDMSDLPRCYWHLANNSFLLHGYHNYSHLLLVEDNGHYWLGVPGVYDSREARAARLFGFPQFTDSYNDQLQLSDDERNSQGTFGYWCCYLK